MDTTYLKSLAVSTNGFVFDPRTGHSFTTNTSGLTILKGLQQGKSTDEIVSVLQTEMAAPPSVTADLEQFIGTLVDLGWMPARASQVES